MGPEGPKSTAGPARCGKGVQKTRLNAGKPGGERGLQDRLHEPVGDRWSHAAARSPGMQAPLLRLGSPAPAARAKGVADPAGGGGKVGAANAGSSRG